MTSLHLLMIIILTFNCQTHSERGCAVALLRAGVIPLVFQAEAGKLQVGLPFLGEELLGAVLQPGQLGPGGDLGLQRTVQLIGMALLHHLLLKPALIHTSLSYKQRQREFTQSSLH